MSNNSLWILTFLFFFQLQCIKETSPRLNDDNFWHCNHDKVIIHNIFRACYFSKFINSKLKLHDKHIFSLYFIPE